MDLTDGELATLRALLTKAEGQAVEFVNIGSARTLTDRGFAVRTGQGWSITAEGRSHLNGTALEHGDRPDARGDSVVGFDPPVKPRR